MDRRVLPLLPLDLYHVRHRFVFRPGKFDVCQPPVYTSAVSLHVTRDVPVSAIHCRLMTPRRPLRFFPSFRNREKNFPIRRSTRRQYFSDMKFVRRNVNFQRLFDALNVATTTRSGFYSRSRSHSALFLFSISCNRLSPAPLTHLLQLALCKFIFHLPTV